MKPEFVLKAHLILIEMLTWVNSVQILVSDLPVWKGYFCDVAKRSEALAVT